MPNMVQILGDRSMGSFVSYPVFDMLIKERLYTSSMTFRTKGVFPFPPGRLVCCMDSTGTPFIIEEIAYDSDGVSEVRCVSVWEALKRKSKGGYYRKYASIKPWAEKIDPIKILNYTITGMNDDPNRWFPFWLRYAVSGVVDGFEIDFDPATSLYDDVYAAALYNQLFLSAYIRQTPDIPHNVDVVLVIKSLNSTELSPVNMGALNGMHTRLTRRLPSNPTHWYIGKTSDYGFWQMASRGRIRTWYENRAYMQETTDWKGPYRYEACINGDDHREWGQITEEIRCEPLKSVEVEIDEVPYDTFKLVGIGYPVTCSIMGVLVSGYVIERNISGGDKTNYSIKIQPDRFYENGEEVTDKWI